MMKIKCKILTILLLICIATASGQSSINSGGTTQSNAAGQHQFAVGEIVMAQQGTDGFVLGGIQNVVLNANEPVFPVDTASVNIFDAAASIQLRLYPNPTGSKVFIELEDPKPLQYELLDNLGAVLKIIRVDPSNNELDMSNYGNGIYYLRVTDQNNQQSVTIPIVKQ